MLTLQHEFPLDMVREDPRIAVELVNSVSSVDLPSGKATECGSENLTEVVSTEYRADSVVQVMGGDGDVKCAVVVEVQRDFSSRTRDRKRRAWVAYTANLFARLDCPIELLVLCDSDEVARRCREPIHVTPRGFSLEVLAMGPADVPIITDEEYARAFPALSVLSLIGHVESPHRDKVMYALDAALTRLDDEDRAREYVGYCYDALSGTQREWMEEWMKTMDRPYYSGLERKFLAQGEARGKAEFLLRMLELRGLAVSESQRDEILACRDAARLDAWADRVGEVSSVAELLTPTAS